MKFAVKISVLILALALPFTAPAALQEQSADCKKAVKCTVCGTELSAAKQNISVKHEGKVFYFASEKCKKAFTKNPDKYIKSCNCALYSCSSHPEIRQKKPGKCTHCKTDLKQIKKHQCCVHGKIKNKVEKAASDSRKKEKSCGGSRCS